MLFKGRLRLPNDPGEGIPIDLVLEDVFLSLDSEGEDFGEWRLDTVEIKRLFSNQFAMQLDGEEMVFIANDALGFAYDGLSALEDVKSRLSKRRIFKGRKPKKKERAGRSESVVEESEAEEAETPEVTPEVPMPEVVPFFPESSPTFADSVAEKAIVDDSIAPVAPKLIEIAETEPPAAAPTQPASPPVERAVEEPAVPVEAASAVESPAGPADELPDSSEDDDDELVIEDVSPYGYVPVTSASVGRPPAAVEPEPSDDEADIEIEEAAPATGAVPREVHPLGDSEPAPNREVHPLGGPDAPDQSVESQPEPELAPEAPAARTEPVEAPDTEAAPAAAEQRPVPSPPDGDSSFFAQWSSNGHAAPEPDPEPAPAADPGEGSQDGQQTQKSGRHARGSSRSRSSLFGRKKSREPAEHEHRYESSKTVGGITRRVCAICGHVSFAGEDVYQDW